MSKTLIFAPDPKKEPHVRALLPVVLLLLSFTLYPRQASSTIYRVNAGTNTVIDAHSVCQDVINSGSSDVMVPTRTSAEWSHFRDNLPPGVTLGACGPLTEYTEVFDTVGAHTWTKPATVSEVEVLVVAGGGGGGSSTTFSNAGGGGGGGGGIVYRASFAVSADVSVTVGAGGAPGPTGNNKGLAGGNSSFGTLTAIGGGGGSGGNVAGDDGGSGGGSRNGAGFATGLQPGSASGGFGSNGGTCAQLALETVPAAGEGLELPALPVEPLMGAMVVLAWNMVFLAPTSFMEEEVVAVVLRLRPAALAEVAAVVMAQTIAPHLQQGQQIPVAAVAAEIIIGWELPVGLASSS
jgi:hypothetical protein